MLLIWNLTPPQYSYFIDKKLLLRPRSVQTIFLIKRTFKNSIILLHPPTYKDPHQIYQKFSIKSILERYPFSGLFYSAGGLLHTP